MPSAPHARWLAPTLVLTGAVLILRAAGSLTLQTVWDDAHMFVRYADQLLATGKVAWNPGGPATYGLTSLLYLVVVVPLRLALPGWPALAVQLSSIVSGALFLAALAALLLTGVQATPRLKGVALVTVFLAIALSSSLLIHLISGMDTMFALASLSVYLWLCKGHEQAPSSRSPWLLGLIGGLMYAVRPDLMLFTTVVPGAAAVFSESPRQRRDAITALGVTLAVFGLQLLCCRWYFGTPVPLPFYAKSTRLYGATTYARYHGVAWRELAGFIGNYWFLFLAIVAGFSVDLRGRLRSLSAVDRGMLASALLFTAYYLFFVLQIMSMGARFYHPVLPIVAYLAAQSVVYLVQRLPRLAGWQVSRRLQGTAGAVLALVLLVVGGTGAVSAATAMAQLPVRFDTAAVYHRIWSFYWVRLDDVSRLPDDLTIATTEVGLPALMNPRKAIIDLAGLNETSIAQRGFSSTAFFAAHQPDLIYLPHPDYREMIADIIANAAFRREYQYIPATAFPPPVDRSVFMDVALRRQGRHYQELCRIVQAAGAACPPG